MVRAGPGQSRRGASASDLKILGEAIIRSALEQDKVEVAARVLEQLARLEGQGPGSAAKRSSREETAPAREVVVYSAAPISEEEWRERFGPTA